MKQHILNSIATCDAIPPRQLARDHGGNVGAGPVRSGDGDASEASGRCRPKPGIRTRLLGVIVPACIILAACGGGGDGGGGGSTASDDVVGPPTVAASLANTTAEAQQAAPAVVAVADAVATRANAINGFSVFLGGEVVPQFADRGNRRQALSAAQAHPLAVQNASCQDVLDPPCSGSATLDTNVADDASTVIAGDFGDFTFNSASGSLLGLQLSFNGRMRIDFLAPFNFNSTLNGLDVKVTLDAFSGSINGVSFGPVSDRGELQVSSQGVVTYTAAGASYRGLHGVSVSAADNYRIGGGTVRVSYWGDSGRYVEVTFENWHVVGNRPTVGSQATIESGQGGITLVVNSSTTSTVVYGLTINANGSATQHIVTATYPAGGGAPTYVAVPAS